MKPLTIGKVSRETGCNIETIRFYEREGILPSPQRTAGGHRIYNQSLVERIVFVRRCRELGFSMLEIRQLLSVVDQNNISCEQVKEIAERHLEDIAIRIEDLRKMQDTLGQLAQKCSGEDVPDCPIIIALQRAKVES